MNHAPAVKLDADRLEQAVASVLDAAGLPKIVQAGHPVLRARALPFTGQLSPDELGRLADIAAARDRTPLELFAMLNPRYSPVGTELASHYEGCLSMSGWQAVVDRAAMVDLAYDDEHGTARTRRFSGWQARIVQHESDHLAGTLYIDKAHTRSLAAAAEYSERWAGPGIAAARAALGF